MTKEQKDEIKNFLIYLHLEVLAGRNQLSSQQLAFMMSIETNIPQFMEIKQENQKIFRWLDEEEEK